jgi:hypothetical protein
MPGSYVVKVVPASIPSSGAQWTLKSVVADGHDVTDGYLAVRHGDAPHQIIVTLTDVRTELYGTLLDGANRPTSAFSVVVFTASPDFWTRGSRRIQATQPANDGRFQIVGLPAGSYYLVAVADLDSDALGDPGFLEQLRQSALMLILSDGESRSLDLRIRGR